MTPEGALGSVSDKYNDYTVAELKDVLKHYGLKVHKMNKTIRMKIMICSFLPSFFCTGQGREARTHWQNPRIRRIDQGIIQEAQLE